MAAAARASHPRLKAVPEIGAPKPRVRAPKGPLGVVDQVRVAFRLKNRLATTIGFIFGGFVPLATYTVAHHAVNTAVSVLTQLNAYIVLGGLIYSALTVFAWGRMAFSSAPKAFGFVLLIEGVMTFVQIPWLSLAALGLLVGINGIATGCTLSRKSP